MELKSLLGTKEKPSSKWSGVIYTLLAILGIAVMAIPAIMARRKAARLAHELDKAKEEKARARVDKSAAVSGEEAAEAFRRIHDSNEKITELRKQLKANHKARDRFRDQLEEITEWDQF